MYVTDLSDGISPADQIIIQLTFTGGGAQIVETSVGTNNQNANVLFFGAASTDPSQTIASVFVTSESSGDFIGIDDLTIGTGVASASGACEFLVLMEAGPAGLPGRLAASSYCDQFLAQAEATLNPDHPETIAGFRWASR